MPTSISMDDEPLKELLDAFRNFQTQGARVAAMKGGNKIKFKLVNNIRNGQDIDGNSYPQIKEVTNNREIAFSGPFTDTRIRSDVSSNQTPFNVTGDSARAIEMDIDKDGNVNIYYESDRADVIFQGNARAQGNVNKPRRDPLGLTQGIPSDYEFDAVADAIEAEIDRIVDGF